MKSLLLGKFTSRRLFNNPMAYETGGNCWSCGSELTALDYGREDTCRKCGRDTKTCKGCLHYDPAAHNECRENQAEWVRDKDRNNRCDYFDPIAASGRGGPQPSSGGAARTGFDALFKK